MRTWIGNSTLVVISTLLTIFSFPNLASSQENRPPSMCHAIAKAPGPTIIKAAYKNTASKYPTVKITYSTHSTFHIESPAGLVIATDFAGSTGSEPLPNVATMNNAHNTHFTMFPDKAIQHILKGWSEDGKKADHYVKIEDVLIRNVTTDIYRSGILVRENGNSIFVFETAGLCIGHVGHLHHTLTPEHIAEIGRIDVLMIPVDGGLTMSINGITELAKQFRSSIILPMHWFSGWSLERFIQEARSAFDVQLPDQNTFEVSLKSLPSRQTVLVLKPRFSNRFDFDN